MPARRYDTSGVELTGARLLELLERIYDAGAPDATWLRGIAETLLPIVDRGAGVNAWLMHRSSLVLGARVSLGHDVDALWAAFARAVPPAALLAPEMMRASISNADFAHSAQLRRYGRLAHAAMGLHSLSGINAHTRDGRIISVGIPAPRGSRAFWPERDRAMWEQIARHLGNALTARGAAPAGPSAQVVLDARGAVLHDERRPADRDDTARLRAAVAAVDRTRRVRLDPLEVLAAWRALHAGRWQVLGTIERDGRRLLVARPDARPGAAPLSRTRAPGRRLSPSELRAVQSLAHGASNKQIGHALGIATSTVGTLLARAAKKLGCAGRLDLARVGRALVRGDDGDGLRGERA